MAAAGDQQAAGYPQAIVDKSGRPTRYVLPVVFRQGEILKMACAQIFKIKHRAGAGEISARAGPWPASELTQRSGQGILAPWAAGQREAEDLDLLMEAS